MGGGAVRVAVDAQTTPAADALARMVSNVSRYNSNSAPRLRSAAGLAWRGVHGWIPGHLRGGQGMALRNARLRTLEGWMSEAVYSVSPELQAVREHAEAAWERGDAPDLNGKGPDQPADDAARMRFLGY